MKMTFKVAIPALLLMSALQASAQGSPGGGVIWSPTAGVEKDSAVSVAADSAIQSELIRSAAVTWFVKSDGAKAD